jgi:hypothetical protein
MQWFLLACVKAVGHTSQIVVDCGSCCMLGELSSLLPIVSSSPSLKCQVPEDLVLFDVVRDKSLRTQERPQLLK